MSNIFLNVADQIDAYEKEFPYLFKKFMDKGLTRVQAAEVLLIIGDTCTFCWESETPCHCANDE